MARKKTRKARAKPKAEARPAPAPVPVVEPAPQPKATAPPPVPPTAVPPTRIVAEQSVPSTPAIPPERPVASITFHNGNVEVRLRCFKRLPKAPSIHSVGEQVKRELEAFAAGSVA